MPLKVLSVFGFGMIGLWEGIPMGFVLQLPPLVVGVISALGSAAATLVVYFLGDRIQVWLLRRRGNTPPEKSDRLIDRVWRRYGVVGFGLLAPCLVGAPLGVALGLFFRAPARTLLVWLLAGIALWAVVLTIAGAYGSASIRRLITPSTTAFVSSPSALSTFGSTMTPSG
ncbi:MAG TPA: small multi-drug export protein [Polyangiaceae bacterium]|nr:small multi-drug export protein [Polyangiaceae bacterium]